MNDSLLSIIFIFAELGVVLLLVIIGLVIRYFLISKKETTKCQELIDHIKSMLLKHHELLENHFKNNSDKKKVAYNIEALSKNEKSLFERLIKISVTKDVGLLKLAVGNIDDLINSYLLLLPSSDNVMVEAKHGNILKKENSSLREQVKSLEISLRVSNDTLENMLGEMSAMYEGGKYEDERVVKEKVYKLRESLGHDDENIKEEKVEIEDTETDGEVEDFNPEENMEKKGEVEDFNLEENIKTDGEVEDFNPEENIETKGEVEDFNSGELKS